MSRVKKMATSALCLALAMVLPLFTGQIPEIGGALCPMHLPVLLCGFICGWPWGTAVGFFAPLLRYMIFGMPPIFPTGISMAFELAAYGCISGVLYRHLPPKPGSTYASLLAAMVGGRLVWGGVRFVLAGLTAGEFPFSAFIAGAVTTALPGILLQLLLIPLILAALKRAQLIPADKNNTTKEI